ncbi:hypothetical protein FHT70_003263 [Rhizobium sp. BK049]|nr:hypothetical protein [Rhizobium sp. BK049]
MFAKKALLTVSVCLTVFGAVAQAQDFEIYVGPRGYREYDGDRYRDSDWDRGRNWDGGREGRRGRQRVDRRNPRLGPCDPEVALDHAREYGMRRARIASITRDRIVVTGIGFEGERTHMVILNDARCNRIR